MINHEINIQIFHASCNAVIHIYDQNSFQDEVKIWAPSRSEIIDHFGRGENALIEAYMLSAQFNCQIISTVIEFLIENPANLYI